MPMATLVIIRCGMYLFVFVDRSYVYVCALLPFIEYVECVCVLYARFNGECTLAHWLPVRASNSGDTTT